MKPNLLYHLISLTILIHLLMACGSAPVAEQPTAPPAETEATLTPLPTPTNEPLPSLTVESTDPLTTTEESNDDLANIAADISEQLMQLVAPTPTPAASDEVSYGGIEGVVTFPLETSADMPPLWVAYSYGLVHYEAGQAHLLAIYQQQGDTWQAVAQTNLESEPSFIAQEAVTQVDIESSKIWLAVDGGTGAHSGTFDLFSFDGDSLTTELTTFSPSPGAGLIQDLDGDGTDEVILNQSDPYVFCYACGVVHLQYQFLNWTNDELAEVQLTDLPEETATELQTLNNQAVKLAQAELWPAASEAISQAVTLAPDNEIVTWNNIVIQYHVDRYRERLQHTGFELLSQLLYGDYETALDILRPYTPAEIFDPAGPVIADTLAQGWEDSLSEWVIRNTNLALAVKPDLAAAYFLRAWGLYLVDPTDPQIITDLQEAAALQPDEPLFRDSLEFLQP